MKGSQACLSLGWWDHDTIAVDDDSVDTVEIVAILVILL